MSRKQKYKIGNRWTWTVQPWEKIAGEIIGMVIWTGVWALAGMAIVHAIVTGQTM